MPVDYDALRGGARITVPENGAHTARLERAALVELERGSALVTEWSENGVAWSSWNRFDGNGLPYTQELLDGLGVDRKTITSDAELTAALDAAAGDVYLVRTDSKQGRQGDRWFTNTYVEGRATPELPDMPADTRDLSPPANDAVADDDIPF